MTTAAADVVALTARPAKLDAHVARMVGDEPTLTDISAVLHLIGTADDVDGVRIQTLCFMASRALGKFDGDVRTASPQALNETVRDARQSCGAAHLGCTEHVLPWIFDGTYCSPTCRTDDMRAHGETWAD